MVEKPINSFHGEMGSYYGEMAKGENETHGTSPNQRSKENLDNGSREYKSGA